jgi:ATP-dependent Lhr-like helicase
LRAETPPLSEKATQILEFLGRSGASFFSAIHAALGGGFPGETRDALWQLVWSGQITNDTFHPLRDLLRPRETKHERGATFDGGPPGSPEFLRRLRSRTAGGGPAQGRWSLIRQNISVPINTTQWSANIAQQLLVRHGIVLRETAIAENVPRGYPTIYPALKTMEDSGWVRRGMFVAGLGAAQFAMPSAVDMLRTLRSEPSTPEVLFLAATDPANPYGTLLPWPHKDSEIASNAETPVSPNSLPSLSRTSGAGVILINGTLAAFFRRRNPAMRAFLPESEPERSHFTRELAKKLAEIAIRRQGRRTGLLIGTIDDLPAREHFLALFLEEAGFVNTALGFQMRRAAPIPIATQEPQDASNADANEADDLDSEIAGTA